MLPHLSYLDPPPWHRACVLHISQVAYQQFENHAVHSPCFLEAANLLPQHYVLQPRALYKTESLPPSRNPAYSSFAWVSFQSQRLSTRAPFGDEPAASPAPKTFLYLFFWLSSPWCWPTWLLLLPAFPLHLHPYPRHQVALAWSLDGRPSPQDVLEQLLQSLHHYVVLQIDQHLDQHQHHQHQHLGLEHLRPQPHWRVPRSLCSDILLPHSQLHPSVAHSVRNTGVQSCQPWAQSSSIAVEISWQDAATSLLPALSIPSF
mmetsp:Transcript_3573/g.6382  ORF Transcript_3573/g.6382 Transcript_3573/m.6382 type:complete len:260 (-) Transcript_3573:2858-3637(-)